MKSTIKIELTENEVAELIDLLRCQCDNELLADILYKIEAACEKQDKN